MAAGRTIRRKLLLLVAACVVPGAVAAPIFFRFVYTHERAALEQTLLQTARALAQALDRELETAQATAEALAGSRSFAEDDVPGMYRHAMEFSRSGLISNYVLSDASGQQLFNTLRPPGQPLPLHGNLPQLRRVFETGQPVVSDVYVGGLLRRPLMSIDVPVKRQGRVVYDLSSGLLPERLGEILARQRLPEGYFAVVLDSQGTIAARSRQPETFVGQAATPEAKQAMAAAEEGVIEAPNKEGVPSHAAFARAPVSRWAVVIGAPTSAVLGEVRKVLQALALGCLLLLVLALGLTWSLGGRIARSVQSLVAPARALGAGEPVIVPPEATSILEAGEVARTMVAASQLLRDRTAERDRARDAERESQQLSEERRRHGEALEAALSENERLVAELREALQNVKTLSGLLPICAWCHKVRDDAGYWQRIETYLSDHTEASISHGMCPDCYARVYPDGGGSEGGRTAS
jgi:hypothetical protein